jgi:hypothetical protein
MSTLADRLEELVQTKFGGNASEMSRTCGLKRTHVQTIIDRQRASPGRAVEHDTLLKIATGTGVTIAWLLGEAPPPTRTIEHDREDPELQAAVAYSRGRYPDEYLRWFATSHSKIGTAREQIVEDIRLGYRKWRDAQAGLEPAVPVREKPADDRFDEEAPFDEPGPKKGKVKATKGRKGR